MFKTPANSPGLKTRSDFCAFLSIGRMRISTFWCFRSSGRLTIRSRSSLLTIFLTKFKGIHLPPVERFTGALPGPGIFLEDNTIHRLLDRQFDMFVKIVKNFELSKQYPVLYLNTGCFTIPLSTILNRFNQSVCRIGYQEEGKNPAKNGGRPQETSSHSRRHRAASSRQSGVFPVE
jgi:hypothetical protein